MRRRVDAECLTTLGQGRVKIPIDGCINYWLLLCRILCPAFQVKKKKNAIEQALQKKKEKRKKEQETKEVRTAFKDIFAIHI